ncbi:hypothetical protein EDC04DRAFT_195070 [Pisolithus marmoratus]|nr:hypothetical protein EDC04DRAFT_195070 [Pisolithus marmoratus]
MQRVVAGTAASKDNLYVAHESALSIFPTRPQSNGVLDWTQTREPHQLSHEIGREQAWSLTAIQRSTPESSSLVSLKNPSNMPARTNLGENNNSSLDTSCTSDRNSSASKNGPRWRLNGSGQLVDSVATPEWELAQDIAKLNLGSVSDLADEVHGHLKTPPQSKLAAAAAVQYNEASPLETASQASIDSSSQPSDHQISPSHSRVSSTDTLDSRESVMSSASHTLRGPPQLKIATGGETKERPHSFSGGLSTADLRRLKQAGEEPVTQTGNGLSAHQWSSSHYRDLLGSGDKTLLTDQPAYPSLLNPGTFGRGQQQYDYRSSRGAVHGALQSDYGAAQGAFFPHVQGIPGASQHFIQPRPTDTTPAKAYRTSQRGFPQALLPNPTGLGYSTGHVPHLSLGTAQQMYDVLAPHRDHPAVTRVQQQHNVFRATHQHSASDPAPLRDTATVALLNNQVFGSTVHSLYPAALGPAFYPHDSYNADVAAVTRLQPQFSGPYGAASNHTAHANTTGSNACSQAAGGPSANNRKLGLYKTELCRSWEEKGSCRYGAKCQFAHGEEELRNVPRHPKYKTEICRTFWVSGACPYGKRCCFIHTELPVPGATPGTDGAPPPSSIAANRERSNSDPNEASNSLLARIQRKNEATPIDVAPPSNSFFNSRPPTGSLRVDTSAINNISKQNKSAYPTFASNALMLSHPEQTTIKSPVPLTAGPDFGRHNATRLDIVGLNQRLSKASTNPSARHSFNGTDVGLDFTSPSTPSATNPVSSFAVSNDRISGSNAVPRSNHVRSGSAGNWGSVTRSTNLTATSAYPQSPEDSDVSSAPWSTSELSVGSTRLADTWM